MYTSGWIPFYRDELNDSLFEDPKWLQRWLWLCTRAAYKPCRRLVGATHRGVEIQPGQIVTTKAYLCRAWGINFRTVQTFLDEMEKQGRLTYSYIDGKTEDSKVSKKSTKSNLGIIITLPLRYVFPPKASEGMTEVNSRNESEDEMPYGMQDQIQSVLQDDLQSNLQHETRKEVQEKVHPKLQTNKEYKNKEISVSKRERENQFFEELKKSEITLDEFCMSLKPMKGKEEMLELAEVFFLRSVSTEDFHPSFSEFKKHFFNWAKQEIEKRRTTQKTTRYGQQENGAGAPKRASDQRRGTEALERTAEDYE